MSRVACAAVLVGLIALFALGAAPTTQPVNFDVHSGYFVSNQFEPDAAESYVIAKDNATFDRMFGAGFVMRDQSHRLPPDAFARHMVVAAILRGKSMWNFDVTAVTLSDNTVTVHYTAHETPQKDATFACPLIVSIPKADYATIDFVANGKLAHRLELLPRPATQPTTAPSSDK